MKTRRFRYLITFVAAMFLANSAAAAAYACLAGLGIPAPSAVFQTDHAGPGHTERAVGTDALCLEQCIRSEGESTQQFAISGSGFAPIAAYSGPCLPVTVEPAGARIAAAPQAAGPPLPILFCSLRN